MQRFALVVAAVLGLGCASVARGIFREPVVSYKDAMITGLGVSGGNLEVVLSIYNPNSFRLDGTGLTYRIAVDSVPFGNGLLSDRFTVQEGDSTTVRLPVSFSYAGIGQAGRQLIQTGSVNYTVSGEITVGTPIGSFTRPYSGRGRLTTIR
ncbi:MAG TPA: LEA type 2 family protein [Gemmatimonadaceae bacterium]